MKATPAAVMEERGLRTQDAAWAELAVFSCV